MQGYVYILMNPSLKGLLKIGKTTRTPQERADELSANTNMPTPFIVVHEEYCLDCDTAEYLIHEELSDRGYRVNDLREFFDAPLKEAMDILSEFVATINLNNQIYTEDFEFDEDAEFNTDDQDTQEENDDLALQYFKKGSNAENGENSFQDYKLALEYYEKAAQLGMAVAYRSMSDIYENGGWGG